MFLHFMHLISDIFTIKEDFFFSVDVVKLKLFSVTSKYVKAGYYTLKVPAKDYHSIKDYTLGNQNQHLCNIFKNSILVNTAKSRVLTHLV